MTRSPSTHRRPTRLARRATTRAVAPACCRRYFDVVAEPRRGLVGHDVEGRRYLDLGSGIAVTNVGHRHPQVVAAIHAQVDALLHTSVVLRHQPLHRAGRGDRPASRRASTTRRCSSATAAPRRSTAPSSWPAASPAGPGIVAFRRAFHGRTIGRHVAHHGQGRATSEGYEPLAARRCTIAPVRRRPPARSTRSTSCFEHQAAARRPSPP